MMPEISLNILDVAENSTRAGAKLVEITVAADVKADTLTVIIGDDGCGMSAEMVRRVVDPFFTTRSTRKVGLGVPFLKFAAEATGGSFSITSTEGVGTTVTAVFGLTHIDRMPLGDISETIRLLVVYHPESDFRYTYRYNDASFVLDTREMREILGDVPFSAPEVSDYIKEFLIENKQETDNGAEY
ncbi:MAG: ATP-binding protein [Planctomycetia bacterium]|nr:ATP-binding protein [Planctomycetia bacterium]